MDVTQKATKEDREWKTHREVGVEVMFPVKQWLPVYSAVESQSCHHRCLDTSPVQDLRIHRDVTWWAGWGGSINNRLSLSEWSSTSLTGNVPGKDESKNDTREFGGAEKRTGEPENSLVLELIWAWISKPTTPTSCWGALGQGGARHDADIIK